MTSNLYSIILPTYNERENLPIITFILNEVALKQYLLPHPARSNFKLSSSKITVLMAPKSSPTILSKYTPPLTLYHTKYSESAGEGRKARTWICL